ncbi:MAG TPA: MotA/TolQ/ExbB proton channel family protein [Polyangiaceae bacterium]
MLIERLMKVALLGSEWVLYVLIGLSVLSITSMLERWLYFRKRTDNLDELRKQLVSRLNADDIAGAEKLLDKSPAIEARVVREALRWLPGGAEAMADAVDSELSRTKKELERGTNLLGTLGNNAPFIGLFGTVLGVIIAFSALGDAGQNTSQMGGVMKGIAEALIATGVGLFVAIPAVVAYNIVQKRISDIESGAVSLAKLTTAWAKSQRGHVSAAESASEASSLASSPELDDEPAKSARGNGAATSAA